MLMGMMGVKVGMTQIFEENGDMVPVTVVATGPCQVIGIKNYANHSSLVLGYGEITKKVSKSVSGIFKKISDDVGSTVTPKRYVKEFSLNDVSGFSVGNIIDVNVFESGDLVSVTGCSKGKGTQGVMKRHNMSGGPASHGSHFHRKPGSIGGATFPARVWKGQRMSGHMGSEQVTVKNLEIFKVDSDNNLLYVRGAIPGPKRGLVYIKK